MSKYSYISILICIIGLSSCVSKTDVLYFQDIDKLTELEKSNSYSIRIQPNDILSITVSAEDPRVVAPFNPTTGFSEGTETLRTYLVDNSGRVDLPLIGSIELANRSRVEASELIRSRISDYVKDPIVNLRIENFKISVLGEVQAPGTFYIKDERITVLDALGLAGDMTIFGNRKSVKVLREIGGKKEFGELDFTSIDVVQSPYYYLQQNDVLIVSPNKAQIQSAGFNRNSTIFISLAGIIISVIAVLTR